MMNAKNLELKLNQYFKGELSREELGLWAMKLYYELMKGEYIQLEKLQVYHFLKTISTFHVIPNDITEEYPCTEKEVQEILEILEGKRDIYYTFNIKIYEGLYKKEQYINSQKIYAQLRNTIEKVDKDNISPEVISELVAYYKKNKNIKDVQTLIGLLECHIKGIIAENINIEEEIADFRQSVGIYVGGTSISKENFLPNLRKLLDCILGDSFFRVSIAYIKGKPHLSLIFL